MSSSIKPENFNKNLDKEKETKIIILGTGPTALGTIYRIYQLLNEKLINENITINIIEQENEIGGLANSVIDENGFCWDLGVHVMGISKYQNFIDAMEECITKWNIIPRCAMAEMSHVINEELNNKEKELNNNNKIIIPKNYIPYPVQNSIPYFPKNIKQKCLEELCLNKEEINNRKKEEEEENFDKFSLSLFGPTLQKIFVRPYNEKVWTVPISEMGISWLKGRVPLIDLKQLKLRCLLTKEELLNEDKNKQAFRYPSNCKGIGEMWKLFSKRFPLNIFNFNQKVIKIDTKNKIIFCINKEGNKQKWNYDILISTIPLTELTRMSGIFPKPLPLKYSTVILVGIGLNGDQSEFAKQLSWAYYPRKEILFYRCTILSNFSSELIPSINSNKNNFWSILCEIGQNSDKELPLEINEQNKIFEKVINDLISVNIINNKNNICSKWLKCLPFGYPIPTKERDSILNKCNNCLEKLNIYSRGRFGGWKYELSNQDTCFQIGIELINKIFLNLNENIFI